MRSAQADTLTSVAIAIAQISYLARSVAQERPGNRFQTSALTSLDRLPDRTTWIQISGLRIDRLPAYAFFRFGNSLRSLDLHDCSIGTIEPGAFAGLHQLQRLTLVGNRLPAVAAHWFHDLVTLHQLVLARNGIERIESGALRPLAGSLRHLDVQHNRLRCLPLDELAHLRHLERLDIVGNPWSCECYGNLQRYLIDRNVGFDITDRCYKENEPVIEPIDRWQHPHVSSDTREQIAYNRNEEVSFNSNYNWNLKGRFVEEHL